MSTVIVIVASVLECIPAISSSCRSSPGLTLRSISYLSDMSECIVCDEFCGRKSEERTLLKA